MDRYNLEDFVAPPTEEVDASMTPVKLWRLKFQSGTLTRSDFMEFFKKESRKYFEYVTEYESVKCMFKEADAKVAIIDLLVEFMLGDNPYAALEKLRLEGNTATVCGKVFKNGEPTYSCRECGMDPTCVLCVHCFKRSAHRFHKYKMSTSGGGGCCDCGDDEAWKKDQYCEVHMAGCKNPSESKIITDAVMERCKIVFASILAFCVNYLEIEPNASLQCLDGDGDGENFCTVLYNDESHTFEQVIQTLTKIAKCRHKDAMEIVAAIDREGRAVVKCDTFRECHDLKTAIENQMIAPSNILLNSRNIQSLRTSVLHINSVACQQFALQLLSWFQGFLVRHFLFRRLFSELVQKKYEPFSIRHILEYDVKLWKTARTCWHRLIISGLLMEYDNKMLLAKEFSRRYATIVEDFIRDDHDHSFSIVSLSVQLFTVPSIAHYLIAHEGIFDKLLHTFYHISIEDYIKNKTLHFPKNMANMSFFKRAAYILYDLRYLLSLKPKFWTPDLRSGFLEGCKALMRVLSVMQGMESVVRQTGQHMDYEPEWECAFNLHIKLATTISQVIDWASSDVEVLRKLHKMVVRSIINNTFIVGNEKVEVKQVGENMANCLVYDVSSRPVSIHLPLTRFYAGIYLHLEAHGMNYDNMMPLIDGPMDKLLPREIIEPVLCTQAMIAQVASGMWRRNGYSLLHQLYFYRNVRCRTEMLDRDIVVLQMGASLMDSNEFLIHMLNKYNLIDWVQPNYEYPICETPSPDDDFTRQLIVIDEFLDLLVIIIGERYIPGVSNVTERERSQKEIMQLLCVKSYSHSELSRALPDANNDTSLEGVIESVAIFKKPSSSKTDTKGVYELKEELYEDFNLYYYHYTKEDKSKAEERQRERRKAKEQLVCCPPPMLPRLTDAFILIANLLQCDVFLKIVSTILTRAIEQKIKVVTDSHLQKIIYMIGYGIQEEMTKYYPFLSFMERAQKYDILTKLEELARSNKADAHRDFILWTIKRWKDAQAKEAAISGGVVPMQQGDEDDEPLCAAEQAKREKETRARLAAEFRAKIMARMESAQKNFMRSNAEMFAKAGTSEDDGTENKDKPSTSAAQMDWQSEGGAEQTDQDNIEEEEGAAAYKTVACLGVDRRLQQPKEHMYKCILCFEDCNITKSTLVCSAFVQTSRVLCNTPRNAIEPAFMHTNSCGHIMHFNCWQDYYQTEEAKEQRRPQRNRPPFNMLQPTPYEFHCPYCRCLSNSVLPISEPLSLISKPNVIREDEQVFPIDLWIEVMKTFSDELDKLRMDEDADVWFYAFPSCESVLKKANVLRDVSQFDRIAQTIRKPALHENWTEVMNTHYLHSLRHTASAHHQLKSEWDTLRLLWESCSYTIRSLEAYLRAIDQPLNAEMSIRHRSCTSNLVRACCLYAASLTQQNIKNMMEPTAELLETIFKNKGDSVLEWECFSMMVTTIFMVPNMLLATDLNKSIIPNGSMMDFYTLQLFFVANIVKAVITYECPNDAGNQMDVDVELCDDQTLEYVKQLPEKIQENIINFYSKYNLAARGWQHRETKRLREEALKSGKSEADIENLPYVIIASNQHTIAGLIQHIKSEMTQFLRCSAIFFHFMTDVEFPEDIDSSKEYRFESICKYLGLDHDLGIYFDKETTFATLMESFASHRDIVQYNFDKGTSPNGKLIFINPCMRPLPTIVPLPEDYSDLINIVSDYICPNNEREEMRSPTMCLICGEIVCGQSYCCQPELGNQTVGACTYHAHYCGAEVGIFLRIRDCQVVYLGRGKGCFVQPPYLDEYGETDQGLRRGNPLRLCQTAYQKIFLHWAGHGLHEEIARLNDNANISVTQWHHM